MNTVCFSQAKDTHLINDRPIEHVGYIKKNFSRH